MKHSKTSTLTTLSIAAALALSACGGGGGGNSSSAATPAAGASSPQTTTSANVSSPQYDTSSAKYAAFQLLNQQRQQCGFQALTENTTLDQAAQAHAAYMGSNGGSVTDTEVSGNAGFTGATYVDRAVHFGYPGTGIAGSSYVGGESAGYWTNATLTEAQYAEHEVYALLSGVYHISIAVWPTTQIGIGWNETMVSGYPEIQSTFSDANMQPRSGTNPLTFPCQGTTGVAYSANGETPVPPNTSGNWGTPIAVAGNPTDTIVLQSGTVTDTLGTVTPLNLLNSSNDPHGLLPAFEAVAYPTTPLTANMTYAVSITGTVNGTPFARSFTFTTGNIVG